MNISVMIYKKKLYKNKNFLFHFEKRMLGREIYFLTASKIEFLCGNT